MSIPEEEYWESDLSQSDSYSAAPISSDSVYFAFFPPDKPEYWCVYVKDIPQAQVGDIVGIGMKGDKPIVCLNGKEIPAPIHRMKRDELSTQKA